MAVRLRWRPKRTVEMKGRGGPALDPRRGDRKSFPYEATVIAGKLLMPAAVQRLHQFMLDSKTIRSISDEMRLAVEALWPARLQAAAERGCLRPTEARMTRRWCRLCQCESGTAFLRFELVLATLLRTCGRSTSGADVRFPYPARHRLRHAVVNDRKAGFRERNCLFRRSGF